VAVARLGLFSEENDGMNVLGWIFIFLVVFVVGVVLGFVWCAISTAKLMIKKGFTKEEIERLTK
jgi:hypothetical protein